MLPGKTIAEEACKHEPRAWSTFHCTQPSIAPSFQVCSTCVRHPQLLILDNKAPIATYQPMMTSKYPFQYLQVHPLVHPLAMS